MPKSDYKRCPRCGHVKSITDFHYRSNGKCKPYCKVCSKQLHSEYIARRRELGKEHPLNVKSKLDVRQRGIIKRYGINLEEYDRMYYEQGGCCAICGEPETYKQPKEQTAPLAVDHDHKTGKVRGLLCRACNSVIGYAKDNIEILSEAITYLKRYKEG